MSASDDEKYRAPALDKGLDILELLAANEDGMSQSEIAKSLDRSPNEIYRMLDRLVRRDYVRRTESDRYVLTLKLFELAYQMPPLRRLVSQATPVLRTFAREAEQAVHLVIHDRNILVVIAQVDSPGYWNVSIRIGSRIDMVNTGSGHVFLAFANEAERKLMLESSSDRRRSHITEALRARLEKVRAQGHEIMESLQVSGVTNLSVPIFGPLGTVLAVLTCPYADRLDAKDAPDLSTSLKLLIAAGNEITKGTT
ncbi:MAG TPA: IclR family transcriptional regulator [Devosia sp.]|nr:IclR family transcriptional regulator [Devosia sp.]